MGNQLAVGLGEIKMSRDPQDLLIAYGLGSCMGIGIYDPVTRVAGLLHAILPIHPGSGDSASKYVDTGIPMLVDMLTRAGALRSRMVVRMAGGANMLVAPGFTNTFDIGSRNIDATHKVLAQMNLKVLGYEVGGNTGRTVRFYVNDGRMTIRTVGNNEREI